MVDDRDKRLPPPSPSNFSLLSAFTAHTGAQRKPQRVLSSVSHLEANTKVNTTVRLSTKAAMSNQQLTLTREEARLRVFEWAPIQHYAADRTPCHCGRYSIPFACGHSIEIRIYCGYTYIDRGISECYQPLNLTKVTNVTLVGYCRFCRRRVGSMCAPSSLWFRG